MEDTEYKDKTKIHKDNRRPTKAITIAVRRTTEDTEDTEDTEEDTKETAENR